MSAGAVEHEQLELLHDPTTGSAAGLKLGGGKAVLIDDGCWQDREVRAARLLAFADPTVS